MMSLMDKEALYATKEEGATNTSTPGPSSSRLWSSGLKNPRIVRVSRTFGGKDRHSKVCTIKGLRDRRIRLSVPTAIQLYDLQDRLNLGQPSKVIDWLLDNTKHDIDKLPPLPAIPSNFASFQHGIHSSQGYGDPFIDANLVSSRGEGNINTNSLSVDVNEDPSIVTRLKFWDANGTMRSKQKEFDDDQRGTGDGKSGDSHVLAQNLFPIASGNASVLPPSTFLSNNHPMYNYYHWEPSSLSLTQSGSHGLSSQNDDDDHHHHHSHDNNSYNSSSLPSPLALTSRSQLFLSSSMASTSSLFPQNSSYLSTHHPQLENDIRQFNRSHLSNNHLCYTSSDLGLKPFPLSMSHHSHHLHQGDDHDKNDDGSWKESSGN